MVFSSLTFICIFLPAVYLLTLAMPGMRAKNFLLALFSLVFYAYGEPVYVVLMVVSTIANWGFGCLLEKPAAGVIGGTGTGGKVVPEESAAPKEGAASEGIAALKENAAARKNAAPPVKGTVSGKSSPTRRKGILAAAVILNLGFLGFFKYAGMAVGTVNALSGLSLPVPDVALPIGISFYTFQAMSYVIDVYRGEVEGQKNYLHVLLYISFFPQLIAGPIVRYRDIEAQLKNRRMTLSGAALGFRRFCFGLAKKVLISNTMGVAADSIFGASFSEINIAGAWIGAAAYVLQIYFDFSGYSDMAIGLARMFGFTYRENFNYPYISVNIREFWRRWHISLSTWLKEYLYIPLGGNRKGRRRTVLNKLLVFFCCGLWHGAAWTFVVWGLIHGFFLLLEEYLPVHKLPKALGWVYTMLVVTFAFVVFRADSLGQAGYIMGQMIAGFHFDAAAVSLTMQQLTPLFLLTFVFAVIAAAPAGPALQKKVQEGRHAETFEALGYCLALVLFVLSFLSLAAGGYNPFIYFRF